MKHERVLQSGRSAKEPLGRIVQIHTRFDSKRIQRLVQLKVSTRSKMTEQQKQERTRGRKPRGPPGTKMESDMHMISERGKGSGKWEIASSHP
jgi:hypothetical protein